MAERTANVKRKLLWILNNEHNFCILYNYTRGGNDTLALDEECFLKGIMEKF